MPDILGALKRQRGVNKGKLTNLAKYAREDHSETNVSELTTRLRRVEKLMEEFTSLELRIFEINPEETSDLAYEECYYTAVSAFNEWIRSKSLGQGVINLDTSNNAMQNGDSQIKLPKINIPTFSGEYAEWQSFYDMYTSTIHESPNLNSVQKFQYLKGLLKGEAAVLLRHITVTEGNYIGALNKLKERYDRKKHIINSFIRTFMEQPVIHNSTAASIKRLMDTSDEVIRGLQALGEVAEGRDPWLIYVIMHKLDDKTKALWAEHSANTTSPDFSELLKFLAKRIDTLESLISSSKRLSPKAEVKSHVVSGSSDDKNDRGSERKTVFTFQCAMCNDKNHTLYQCTQFHTLRAEERKDWVKRVNRCLNCLGANHAVFRCPSRRRCQKCNKKHNTLLHQDEKDEASSDTTNETYSSASGQHDKLVLLAKCNLSAILPTAIIHVFDASGNTIPCRALLDSGSQASFITESCTQRLQLKKRNARISICGMGQTGSGSSRGLVTITIKPEAFPQFSLEALVMSKITSQIPSQNMSTNFKPWSGIKLADPQFNTKSNIDILIGADYFFNILLDGQIKTKPDEPVLQNTMFGWIVSGQAGESREQELISMLAVTNHEDIVDIDKSLRKFWELESIKEDIVKLSPEEEFCERHFKNNVAKDQQGRFVVKLPFKRSPTILGESLACAIQRLRAMERRFIRDHNFAQLYHQFMREYEELNHMIEVPPPNPAENEFYLPHHGVLKNSSSTTKLRVVFDGSSKSSSGISLNECLAVGPNLQSSLFAIIMRFREHKVVFSADVEKMYRQINVSSEDTKYQKIVWRSSPSEPIRHFRLMTVTYGLASASYLATRSIKQIADENQQFSPHAAHVILRDIYVDDLMTGADDEIKASQLKEKVSKILTNYGFNLRKWKSNEPNILRTTPHNHQEADSKTMQDHASQDTDSIKVLGIDWNPKADSFSFTSNIQNKTNFTKRTVLSEASRLFDPLGWLAPVVISFKIFLQTLWGANLEWDEPLPSDKLLVWERIRNNLKSINAISIPRFLETTSNSSIEMHGFCDASQLAYAAVVFFKTVNADGVSIKLIASKSRVAPVKQQSLPRLELCAAVLLTDLIKLVKKESHLSIKEVHAWTDSQIVLDWLGSHPRRWKTFVGNRTSEILSTLSRKNWRHVPSAENPADCASRGLSPNELKFHKLWWNGPTWLLQSSEFWPLQKQNYGNHEEHSSSQVAFSFITTPAKDWYDEIISKFSSFGRLLRVMSYVIKFAKNIMKLKQFRANSIDLQREELLQTIRILCQHEQKKYYDDEIKALQSKRDVKKCSSLRSLNPFLDEFGLLRVGGRLQNSLAPYSTKHPLILHGKSRITLLILRDNHLTNKHAGPTLLLAITRQEYWIPNGKIKAKEVVRKCVICTKFKSQCQQQLMGSLPGSRVELIRPFLKTGVDYAGPIAIHLAKGRGQRTYKAYICLFVCLSTKAVHLELVGDLSSDAFLGALKRFTARRGVCSELHSDNGTNFVGSDSKLQKEFNKLIKGSNHIADYFSKNRIDWHFIPPNAPHFGGLWEAAIKSTKFHIKRVIGKSILTIEEMNTLLAEVEGILNSRPLCAINDTEVDPITPSHFLIGHPLTKIPESDITHLKISHLTRWQLVQQISQHFWKKWYIEYLTSLQQRSKWRNRIPSLQINDVVLIKDNNLPVNQWLLGKITELHPGSDGQVRVVTLKTQHSDMKRPIHKLCLLPISRAEEDEIQNSLTF